jgi:hypothetical protein
MRARWDLFRDGYKTINLGVRAEALHAQIKAQMTKTTSPPNTSVGVKKVIADMGLPTQALTAEVGGQLSTKIDSSAQFRSHTPRPVYGHPVEVRVIWEREKK